MRRLAIASLGLAAALAVAACGGGATASPAPTSAPAASSPAEATPAATVAPGSPAAAGGSAVTIANFAFAPASVTVKVGQGVAWANKDTTTHTVTWDDGTAGSGNLAAGSGTYTRTFDTAGTFTYHCSIHPSMTGTVVVNP